MKLNYKRTICVGFAFFLICAFWQAYDNTIPLILTNKFGMSQAWSGVIMALDNILALFLLPLFGAISDKHTGRRGRRTPFIVFGTIVAAKIGRKKTILGGVVMLAVAFGVAAFLNAESPTMLMNAMFCLAGIGWATINVNSFPMVVEMCSGSDVGRYTGFYYTASMAAQVVTPMFSGFLMDKLGMTVLFPYAAIFVAGAFVTMLFVRHGDSRPIPAKGLEALDVDD